MSAASLAKDFNIEVETRMHRQVLLMPRYGIERVLIRDIPISLPRLRFLDKPTSSEEVAPEDDGP